MFLSTAPEITTAITDGLLGLIALFLSYKLYANKSQIEQLRQKIWSLVLLGFGLSAIIGVPAHAIYSIAGTTPTNLHAQTLYWAFLGLLLFFMSAMLGVATTYDLTGTKSLRKKIIIISVSAFLFYIAYFIVAVMNIVSGYFIIFIGYSAVIMLFALVSYIALYFKKKDPAYLFIIAAIIVAITGNTLQSMRNIYFTAIWEFDYNSVYHFFMMISLVLFYLGVNNISHKGTESTELNNN